MNQIAVRAPSAVLAPASMGEAMKLADMMANSRLVPAHLQNKPADCLLVIEQAMRWRMSPFAVAQATSVISGKLMFEGKLTAAAVHSSGALEGRLEYAFEGDGDMRTVIVSGVVRGEKAPRTIRVRLRDARTANKMWQVQPDQQLVYHGARVWARRHVPEVMLGVYAPEEFSPDMTAQTVDVVAEAPAPVALAEFATSGLADARADMVADGLAHEVRFPNGRTRAYPTKAKAREAIQAASERCETLDQLEQLAEDNAHLLERRPGEEMTEDLADTLAQLDAVRGLLGRNVEPPAPEGEAA